MMWKVWILLGVFYMAFGLIMIWTASKHLDGRVSKKEKMFKLYHGSGDGPGGVPTAALKPVGRK